MTSHTASVRISATLPPELASFLDEYQRLHALESRSAALAEAVRSLREQSLHAAYRELGDAQRSGEEVYPPSNADGLVEGSTPPAQP